MDHVPGSLAGVDVNASVGVARNGVARARNAASDSIRRGTVEENAGIPVGQCPRSRDIQADEVTLNCVSGSVAPHQLHPGLYVSRNHVARCCCRPADAVAARLQQDSGPQITQRLGPGDVGANEVALDHVGRAVAAGEIDAVVGVAGDDVACPRQCSTNRVARRTVHRHAHDAVAQRIGPRGIHTDEVALDHVGRAVGAEQHSRAKITGDDIARSADRAADLIAVGCGEHQTREPVAAGQAAGDVRAEIVALDRVGRRAGLEVNRGYAVARDDVAGARVQPADQVAGGTLHGDAIGAVADDQAAGGVQADKVALNHIAPGGGTNDVDAHRIVAGNGVARASHEAADLVAGAIVHLEAVILVAQAGSAICAQPDVVALNDVARRASVEEADGRETVGAADDIALAGVGAANDVADGGDDQDAIAPVGGVVGAGEVRADIASFDVVGPPAGNGDAVLGETVDDQGTHRDVAGVEGQAAVGHAGAGSVEFHDRSRGETRLGRTVNEHGRSDGQCVGEVDGGGRRQVEQDAMGGRGDIGIGVGNGGAQGTVAAIVGVDNREIRPLYADSDGEEKRQDAPLHRPQR